MTDPKTSKLTIPRTLQRLKESETSRRSIINELNFTYKRLLRLLPGIVKRVDAAPGGKVLNDQDRMDRVIAERLGQVAIEQGEPPESCICEEANAMVENIYNAERAAPTRAARASAIIRALKSTRAFLIRVWARLIGTLSPDKQPRFLKEAKALQASEADLHRELVSLGQQIDASAHRADPDQPSKGTQ